MDVVSRDVTESLVKYDVIDFTESLVKYDVTVNIATSDVTFSVFVTDVTVGIGTSHVTVSADYYVLCASISVSSVAPHHIRSWRVGIAAVHSAFGSRMDSFLFRGDFSLFASNPPTYPPLSASILAIPHNYYTCHL